MIYDTPCDGIYFSYFYLSTFPLKLCIKQHVLAPEGPKVQELHGACQRGALFEDDCHGIFAAEPHGIYIYIHIILYYIILYIIYIIHIILYIYIHIILYYIIYILYYIIYIYILYYIWYILCYICKSLRDITMSCSYDTHIIGKCVHVHWISSPWAELSRTPSSNDLGCVFRPAL